MRKRHLIRASMLATVVALFMALASPAWAADFTVTNTNDSGDGSLRKAITDANAKAGLDTIKFNISGDGPHTIKPNSALPQIDDPVVIDGYTQSGASKNTLEQGDNAVLEIELDGTNAGSSAYGLVVGSNGGGSTVRGLAINGFSGYGGIHLLSDGNTVEGNYIGTNVAGDDKSPNAAAGVLIENAPNNTVGGTTAGSRNVISGNGLYGVWIFGTAGTADSASGNEVLGNYIGTDASGTKRLANGDPGSGFGGSGSGVQITNASGNTIGGTDAGARNILSGNGQFGVDIAFISSNNKVQGNYIGTDVSGIDSVTNEQDGVRIENRSSVASSGNVIGGTEKGARNVISGNNSSTSLYGPPNSGVAIRGPGTSKNNVQGNYIGTDKDGAKALGNSAQGNGYTGNGQYGVYVLNSPNNTIGGTEEEARNVISGNEGFTRANGTTGTALEIYGQSASGNTVEGNYVGTDVSGAKSLDNLYGVYVEGAPGNTIGGTETGARNVISGNDFEGVTIDGESASENKVEGNYVGTDVSGTGAVPNATGGTGSVAAVRIQAPRTTVGGTGKGAGNLISGNGHKNANGTLVGFGISIGGQDTSNPDALGGSVVQGNLVGTDKTGTKDLGNFDCGVIVSVVPNNTIGGTEAGAGNVISGNGKNGIQIDSSSGSGNMVQGNHIGTDESGAKAIGNDGVGVLVSGAPGNTVGGTEAGAGNVVAFNGDIGVDVHLNGATGNAILANSIFSNGGLGIDLNEDDVTANDDKDPDTGPNNLQNYPVLDPASTSGGSTTVTGKLNSTPNTTFTVQFFASPEKDPSGYGQGKTFLGQTTAKTDGSGNASFTFTGTAPPEGKFATATATDPDGNTSEFSKVVAVTSEQPPPPPGTNPPPSPGPPPSTGHHKHHRKGHHNKHHGGKGGGGCAGLCQ